MVIAAEIECGIFNLYSLHFNALQHIMYYILSTVPPTTNQRERNVKKWKNIKIMIKMFFLCSVFAAVVVHYYYYFYFWFHRYPNKNTLIREFYFEAGTGLVFRWLLHFTFWYCTTNGSHMFCLWTRKWKKWHSVMWTEEINSINIKP